MFKFNVFNVSNAVVAAYNRASNALTVQAAKANGNFEHRSAVGQSESRVEFDQSQNWEEWNFVQSKTRTLEDLARERANINGFHRNLRFQAGKY